MFAQDWAPSKKRHCEPVRRIYVRILLVSKKNYDLEWDLFFPRKLINKELWATAGLAVESLKVTNTTTPKAHGDEGAVGTRSPLHGRDLEPRRKPCAPVVNIKNHHSSTSCEAITVRSPFSH